MLRFFLERTRRVGNPSSESTRPSPDPHE